MKTRVAGPLGAVVLLLGAAAAWLARGSAPTAELDGRGAESRAATTADAVPTTSRAVPGARTPVSGEPPVVWRVVGRVMDPEGRPIARARLHIAALRFGEWNSAEEPSAVSDATGEYVASVPARADGETIWVTGDGEGFWPTTAMVNDLEGAPAAPIRVDLYLRRGACARGRVVDAAGQPVRGAHVEFDADAELLARFDVVLAGRLATASARTGADGVFLLPMAGPGPHVIKAERSGTGTAGHGPEVVPAGTDWRVPDLVLRGDGAIAGVVVHENGTPLAGLPLRVESYGATARDSRAGMFRDDATSGEDGRFRVTGLRPGRYQVSVSVEGGHRADAPWVETGTGAARIVVRAARLRLRRSDGAAWDHQLDFRGWTGAAGEAAARALAAAPPPELPQPDAYGRVTLRMSSGGCSVLVPAGSTWLFTSLSLQTEFVEDWVHVPADQVDSETTLVVRQIRFDGHGGRVRVRTGASAGESTLRLESPRARSLVARFTREPQGTWISPPLVSGSYWLRVEPASQRVVVVRDGETTEIDLR